MGILMVDPVIAQLRKDVDDYRARLEALEAQEDRSRRYVVSTPFPSSELDRVLKSWKRL